MDRRKFIKEVLLWSAGLSLSVPRFIVPGSIHAAEGAKSTLSFTEGPDYESLVSRALSSLGGMKSFVNPGDTVVVKPNIGWDRTPEQGANTNPIVVRAVVQHVLDAGASKVLVFDRTCNEKRRCYTNSGIEKSLKKLNDKRVELDHIDRRKFVPVDIDRGKSLTRREIYLEALKADCYINVPIAKHHGLSKLTLGLKNSMGVIGGDRGEMHHDLGQKLADLATVVRPKLTIVDATRLLLRNGPQGGDIKDVKIRNALIASTDPVAADAYATTLFDMKPQEIESTVAAYKLGLGEMDIAKINILKS
nr:DUF362 domain-containing protein [Desulfobulbaceae bacterium]